MAEQDDWVVIGGKGRPRRTPEQQQKHLQARAAAARALAAVQHTDNISAPCNQNIQPCADDDDESEDLALPDLPAGSSPAQYAAQQQLAILAAAMAKSQPTQQQRLPGWDPPPELEWKVAGCSSSNRGKKRSNKACTPKTPEEQAQRLAQQVLDISKQVQQSQMYSSLQTAMQTAAAAADVQQQSVQHIEHLQTGNRTSIELDPQQRPQLNSSSSSSSRSWSWQHVQQLVVYGLGSPDDSKVSRYQLALVLLLQQSLPGLAEPPQLYDPAFSQADRLLLQHLGLQVINSNEECRRRVNCPTLFYLPHLEGALCDNLLDANWSASCLAGTAILGNSFTTYDVRWSAPEGCRPKTRRPDKLLQLLHEGAVMEVPVPDHDFFVASAFNDTSLHLFKPAGATGLEP